MLDDFFAAIEQAGLRAAAGALTRAGEMVSGRAKELAPVRRVFADQSPRTELKSIAAIEGDRDIRRRLGLGPERTHIMPPTTVTKPAPQFLHRREVVQKASQPNRLRLPSAQARLDRRGRYELRAGRAIHGGNLGGKLRDEIFSTAARIDGRIIAVRVVSPTAYAKYQEFGTRHNAAHPYLRPALHESVGAIKEMIATDVAQAAREAVGSVRINVEWKLKAAS